jgi:Homing endonuclease associated repeat
MTTMTNDQIVEAIHLCVKKLDRNPNLRDLRLIGGVSEIVIYKRFGGLAKALAAAGLEATGPGFNQPEDALLLDWAAVARKLGKIPSVREYGRVPQASFSCYFLHHTVGAPSFASLKLVWNSKSDCGRKGWVR